MSDHGSSPAQTRLAREWAAPLGLERIPGDWRPLCTAPLPAALLPQRLPGDELTALWASEGRPVAWTSQVSDVDEALRRILAVTARRFGLAFELFRLPALARSKRPVLIVWERADEPASPIRRTQAPKVPLPLTDEEKKRGVRPGGFADQ